MSFLNFLPIIGEIIDRIIPDKNAAAKAKAEIALLEQSGELQLMLEQIKVNRQEAGHDSLFVAGWRPSIGWICSLAFAYHFIIFPVIATIAALNQVDISILPDFDISAMLTVLGGLLGLGGLRTFEKFKGVARNTISVSDKEPKYGDGHGNKN